MKKQKFLVVILVCIILLPIIVLPASALGSTAYVNEDYTEITWGSHKYYRVNSSDIVYIPNAQTVTDLKLADAEYEHVHYINATANDYAIELSLEYNGGGYVTYYYIRDDKLDEYNSILANGGDTFLIYLGYVDGVENMTVSRSVLYSNPNTMTGSKIARYERYIWVEYSALDGQVELVSRGSIFEDENGKFYYLDDYQFASSAQNIPIAERDTVTVYEITDKKLIQALTQEPDYDSDYDFSDTDGAIGIVVFSVTVFAIVLGVIPLVVALVSFILGFFAKKGYKRFFFTVSLLCLMASAVTFITVILCIIFNIR